MLNNKKSKPSASGIIVYFNAEKTSSQVCKPKMEGNDKERFDGNWAALAQQIAGNTGYYSFEII